jgi:hypothetical protein
MKEKTLYPVVERFSRQHFDCFSSKTYAGLRGFGVVDVVCAKRIVSDLNQTNELISIEVKTSTRNYCKIIGQALGYSIFSHRCYLAVPFKKDKGFSREQKTVANKLGVGLIEIHVSKQRSNCREVLTSSYFQPQEDILHKFLHRLSLVECVICKNWFDSTKETRRMDKAIADGLPYAGCLISIVR